MMTLNGVVRTILAAAILAVTFVSTEAKEKTEAFDRDPGWHGVNNRSARIASGLRTIQQDFGWSEKSNNAGGEPGELGGFIAPAGEFAYYGTSIRSATFDDKLSASGTMLVGPGSTHMLLGFFNASTAKEWRTNNTIAMRINARSEDLFFAYVEYCTSKWRAGGDTTPFPSITDPDTGRWNLLGFPTKKVFRWTLTYDPKENDGNGVVTATLGDKTALCNLDPRHKADGATFTHFGIMNVAKSADTGSEIYIDNLTIEGKTETFDRDPKWDAQNNRTTYQSNIVRPLFDFGFSPTRNADGRKKGELGGQTFRGDCRYPERMACYGDKIGPLTLDKPLKASGRIAMTRGVTDSTTLFGFYNERDSMRVNDSQNDAIPESVVGIHVEGPSSEGFLFYPVWRSKGGGGGYGRSQETNPYIYPDGASHEWSLKYDPDGAEGNGQITIKFDGNSETYGFKEGIKESGTTFDRFGIVTSWIDGNSQDVFWDDITYTIKQ